MRTPIFEITKSAKFDAAHFLRAGPEHERYRRMHGHSFTVEASVRGTASAATGWVADLGALETALGDVAAGLDHRLLNEIEGLEQPTLERLCVHFAEALKARLPGLSRVTVARPSSGESCTFNL